MKGHQNWLLAGLLISCLCSGAAATAQSFYTHTIDSLLVNVDKSKVPYNILYDRAFPISRLFEFGASKTVGGTTYKDTLVLTDRFIQAYSELYSSLYAPPSVVKTVDQLKAYLANSVLSGEFPLGFININYSTIRPDAVTLNLLSKDPATGLYSDVPGRTTEPYTVNKVVMAANLVRYINNYHPVNFTYDPNFVLQNDVATLMDSIAIDFGLGATVAIYNSPIATIKGTQLNGKQTFSVYYASTGDKTISFTIRLKDGRIFRSTTKAVVRNICEDANCTTVMYDGCQTFYDTVKGAPLQFPGEPAPRSGLGEYRVYFRKDCNSGGIRKPLLRLGEVNFPKAYELGQADLLAHKRLFDSLHNAGFDIIVFNNQSYKDGVGPDGTPRAFDGFNDYLERRAFTVIRVIQKINQNRSGAEKLVVIGVSHTAALARAALVYMEKNHMDHQTKLMVSIDGAQLGGNGPIGEQYFEDAIAKELGDESFRALYPNSPNGQELGLHFAGVNSVVQKASPLHDSWQHLLDSLGFPVNCRNIAVANGNYKGESFPGNLPFFTSRVVVAPAANLFFFRTRFTDSVFAEYNVHLTADKGSSNLVMEAHYPNFTGVNAGLSKMAAPLPGSVSLDICPGSSVGSQAFGNVLSKSTDTYPFGLVNFRMSDTLGTGPAFIIIPTKSALAVTNSNPDLGENLCRNLVQTHETPFDAYFVPPAVQGHTVLFDTYVHGTGDHALQFILDEIAGRRSTYGIDSTTVVPACGALAAAAEVKASNFIVYPNPSQGILNIEPKPGTANMPADRKRRTSLTAFSVKLYDMNFTVKKEAISTTGVSVTLNTSDLPFGVYYVIITHGNQSETVKVLVQK